ncbi:MAG: hypothetical protein KJ579_01390 [Verrucomicrobia bacterium]|nr:hypothetical protein [Verrucomicrobiota bacterium]
MKSEIRGPRSVVRSIILAVFAAFALNVGAAERPIVQPDCRVSANGARSFGVKVDLLSLAQAKRPTKQVYVEEAVALWRPAPGQMVAANEAAGTVADVNAAVSVKETAQPKSWREIAVGHIANNAGRYIGGAVLVAVGAGGYALYEANKGGGTPKTTISIPPTDARQSPPVSVTAGDNSPVNVSVVITAMPPE